MEETVDTSVEWNCGDCDQLMNDLERIFEPELRNIGEDVESIFRIAEDINSENERQYEQTFRNGTESFMNVTMGLQQEINDNIVEIIDIAESISRNSDRQYEETFRNGTESFNSATAGLQQEINDSINRMIDSGAQYFEDMQGNADIGLAQAAPVESSNNVATGVGAGLVGAVAGYLAFKFFSRSGDDSSFKRVDQPLL